jgi:hypothetical protein
VGYFFATVGRTVVDDQHFEVGREFGDQLEQLDDTRRERRLGIVDREYETERWSHRGVPSAWLRPAASGRGEKQSVAGMYFSHHAAGTEPQVVFGGNRRPSVSITEFG